MFDRLEAVERLGVLKRLGMVTQRVTQKGYSKGWECSKDLGCGVGYKLCFVGLAVYRRVLARQRTFEQRDVWCGVEV